MKFLFILSLLLLTACDRATKEETQNFNLPNGMEDCKIYYLRGDGVRLYVTRCPNSSTSTSTTDNNQTPVMVIDGVEYVKKEKHEPNSNTNK